MERSGFFPSISGDRRYRAMDWATYFASFIGNGIFPLPSTGLHVTPGEGMQVALNTGRAWINGFIYHNDDILILPLGVADGVLRRIDRIVIRWSLQDRSITAHVKRGALASNPTPPPLQRDADVFELAVADVLINNGVISITQANITDQRFNMSLCGIATGLIQQIDFDIIAAQFNDFFAEYKPKIQADYEKYITDITFHFENFLDWLAGYKGFIVGNFEELAETIRDILDAEAAAKLLLMIQDLQKVVPSEIIGTVEHNLHRYPLCNLYRTNNAAGMTGAGMTGAGGENLVSVPATYELIERKKVMVMTIAAFADFTTIHKINDREYTFTSESGTESLFLQLS